MGDKSLQAEGKMDKAKGEAHRVAGDVKDAARLAGRTRYQALDSVCLRKWPPPGGLFHVCVWGWARDALCAGL